MTPNLTEEQRQAIHETNDRGPVTLVDPTTNTTYILMREDIYQRYRALFHEDEFQVRESYPLIDEVAGREGWNDPEMDAYDALDPRRPS